MKNTRRMKRMARNRKKVSGLNLTSLMDVFTILVFFLLANSSSSEVVTAPKQIKMPDSIVETKPRETIVILVSPENRFGARRICHGHARIVEARQGNGPGDRGSPATA